jgi:hypothetical protein
MHNSGIEPTVNTLRVLPAAHTHRWHLLSKDRYDRSGSNCNQRQEGPVRPTAVTREPHEASPSYR